MQLNAPLSIPQMLDAYICIYVRRSFCTTGKQSLPEPGFEDHRDEVVRRGYRCVARVPVAVELGPVGKSEQPLGSATRLFFGNKSGVGVSENGHLQNARIAHLRAPEALGHADFAESRGQRRRVPQQWRVRRRAKPVHDSARVRRGVSQRVRTPEHVVLVPHPGIAPSVGAEEVKVGKGAERRKLQKHPRRHLANRVPRNERPKVGVVFQTLELSLPAVAVAVVEGCEVVGEDRVTVLVRFFSDALDQPGLRGVLHVEGQRQQEAAKLAVDRGEVDEMPEVEPGVLAVPRPAYALGEQRAIGREPEVMVLAGQDARGFRFGARRRRPSASGARSAALL